MSKKLIIEFRKNLEGYRNLLLGSRDSLARIDRNHTEIKRMRSALIQQYAGIEDEIKKYSQGPMVADPVWRKYQDAYGLALSSDILQRVGPAIDAVLDDLDYVTAKYKPKKSVKQTTNTNSVIYINLNNLHPKIIKKCNKKFLDGHYSDAVLTAYKVVLNEIKDITNINDKDGKPLVEQAFSLSNPLIKLNSLATQSDKDEQQGFMLLYSGAALGIRNPKAHDLVEQDDPKRALQLLAFASLLMDKLDERIKAEGR